MDNQCVEIPALDLYKVKGESTTEMCSTQHYTNVTVLGKDLCNQIHLEERINYTS